MIRDFAFVLRRTIYLNTGKCRKTNKVNPLTSEHQPLPERGFSTQNDIKTADNNWLSADRLNKLMRIAMNKTSLEDFDFEKAVNVWREVKQRRAFQTS